MNRTFSLIVLAFSLVTAVAEETRIVLIGHQPDHPFGSHMYLHECGLLAQCLNQSPDVRAVVSDGWPKDPETLNGVKAIVLYTSPGGNILLNPANREQAERLLQAGVGYSAIHWATDADVKLGTNYLQILGGWFNTSFSGLQTTPTRVEQLAPDHPICRGWKDYDQREEIYLNLKFLPDTKPIFKVKAKDQDQVVGWAYERPNSNAGRSFGTTLGHFHDNFGKESFRRLLVNGILWTAHCEIPAEGAPCRVSESDLHLPPRRGKSETIKLFNGTNLDGWIGHAKYWSVTDGVIVAKNTEPVPVSTYLLTTNKYTDFRLTAKVKLVTSEMHSGIALWGRVAPEHGDPYTYAGHLVMFPSGWGFWDLYGRERLGVDPAPAKKAGRQHDWNTLEILAQGDRIRLVVNGTLVADWHDPEPHRIQAGPIGLQLHSNQAAQEIHFKDLVLTTFPEDKLTTVNEGK